MCSGSSGSNPFPGLLPGNTDEKMNTPSMESALRGRVWASELESRRAAVCPEPWDQVVPTLGPLSVPSPGTKWCPHWGRCPSRALGPGGAHTGAAVCPRALGPGGVHTGAAVRPEPWDREVSTPGPLSVPEPWDQVVSTLGPLSVPSPGTGRCPHWGRCRSLSPGTGRRTGQKDVSMYLSVAAALNSAPMLQSPFRRVQAMPAVSWGVWPTPQPVRRPPPHTRNPDPSAVTTALHHPLPAPAAPQRTFVGPPPPRLPFLNSSCEPVTHRWPFVSGVFRLVRCVQGWSPVRPLERRPCSAGVIFTERRDSSAAGRPGRAAQCRCGRASTAL